MTYQEQLKSEEWKQKRLEIISRDGNKCRSCGRERSKYMGVSLEKIKTYEDLCHEGLSASKHSNNIKQVFITKKNMIIAIANYVDSHEIFELEELKFATRWRKPLHQFDRGHFEWICFKSNIMPYDIQMDLNVHHKYYIEGKMAWDYDPKALVTLCQECHQKEHELNPIFVYDQNGKILYTMENCKRCNGSGYIPEYYYFQNGVCFECFGHGVPLK